LQLIFMIAHLSKLNLCTLLQYFKFLSYIAFTRFPYTSNYLVCICHNFGNTISCPYVIFIIMSYKLNSKQNPLTCSCSCSCCSSEAMSLNCGHQRDFCWIFLILIIHILLFAVQYPHNAAVPNKQKAEGTEVLVLNNFSAIHWVFFFFLHCLGCSL
jgi:hypothetical protein